MKVLSPEQVQQYQQDGYVFPIDVFTLNEVSDFSIKFEQFRTHIGGKIKEQYNHKPHLLSPWITSIVRHPKILDAVEDVLGSNILCWTTQFFVKDANDKAYVSWHQDNNYWRFSPTDVVTAWVALTPSKIESGCMNVVPKSHKQRVQHIETLAEYNLLSRGQEIAVKVNPDDVVPIVLEAGQMSLHHVMIFHGSELNLTNQPRVGLAIRYMATHVEQTIGEDDSALLVRGVDDFNNFGKESDPIAEFDKQAVAQHNLVIDKQLEIINRRKQNASNI